MMLRMRKKIILQYILIYLMLITSRAAIYVLYKELVIYIILGLCTICAIRYKSTINMRLYILFALLACSLYLTRIIAGSGWGVNAYLIIVSTSWCAYTAYSLSESFFVQRFINLTSFFAIISLFGWMLLLFAPNVLNFLLPTDYPLFGGSKGLLFFVYRYGQLNSAGDRRNVGIFTEPGIYQIVLNSALFCMLFYPEQLKLTKKKYYRLLILFVVTIISTQSTTGYIALAAILIVFLFTKKDIKLKRKILILLGIVMLVLIVDYIFRGSQSFVYSTVINKIFNTSLGSIDLNVSSGYWRMNTIIAGWNVFLKHPLGSGDGYYNSFLRYSAETFTSGGGLIQVLGICGILTTCIIGYIILRPAWINKRSVPLFLLITFLWVNTALAQSEIVYACILMLGLIKKEIQIL